MFIPLYSKPKVFNKKIGKIFQKKLKLEKRLQITTTAFFVFYFSCNKTNTLKHKLSRGSDFWGPLHWWSPIAQRGPRSKRVSQCCSRWCWLPRMRCWREHLIFPFHLFQFFWKSFRLQHRLSDQQQLGWLCLLARQSPWQLHQAKILFALQKKND